MAPTEETAPALRVRSSTLALCRSAVPSALNVLGFRAPARHVHLSAQDVDRRSRNALASAAVGCANRVRDHTDVCGSGTAYVVERLASVDGANPQPLQTSRSMSYRSRFLALRAVPVVALAGVIAACGDDPVVTSNSPRVARLALSPADTTVLLGSPVRLRVAAWDAAGAPIPTSSFTPVFTVSPQAAATVSTDGVVTTRLGGPVTIRVQIAGQGDAPTAVAVLNVGVLVQPGA